MGLGGVCGKVTIYWDALCSAYEQKRGWACLEASQERWDLRRSSVVA